MKARTFRLLKTKAAILKLISFYFDNTIVEKVNLSNSSTIDKLNSIVNYIDGNISKDITVEKLASIAHLHPNYFIKLFRKHIGVSPINYLNKKRIEETKRLLNTNIIP